jgi:eukaryotic-like serine/threonine-protein kinase
MPPEIIAGRYRVEREVGRGGMGSVWLCRDELLGREVAVKQVGHPPGESAPDLARAMREARSSAPLSHPNVVSIYDAIEEGDHIWLVMEYVPGRTLAQLVTQDGRLTPERAARIGAQVADGLAAAHGRGTVHRDVKPGNILVSEDDRAKISDFGISRTTGDPTLTQSGLVSGTPAYFSPQLARGEEPTPADDVWALGATLYAAVEGRSPYPEQRNAIAMLSQIVSGTPPRPQHADFLTEPIGRMLDPDPGSRWSMADAAHALRRLAAEHATDGTREATAVAVSRQPAAAATAADPTPTPTSTFAPAAPATAAPATAAEAGRPRRRGGLLALAALLLAAVALGGYLLLAADGNDDPRADPAATSSSTPSDDPSDQSPTPDDEATTEDAEEPSEESPTPEEEATTADSEEPSDPPAGGGSRTQFVEGYYGVLPDDTESGYAMLAPEYQSRTSFDRYQGFWSTIDAVTVDDARPAGPDAVDVTLTYSSGGGTQQEVRRIFLERGSDGYLITDDEIVG